MFAAWRPGALFSAGTSSTEQSASAALFAARATAMALIADITNPKILTKLTKLNLGHVRSLLLELAEHFTHEEVVC